MLFRNDPFFADFDRFVAGATSRRLPPSIPVDAVRHGDRVELRFDLPGVSVEHIDLTVDKGVLRLAVERPFHAGEDNEVISHERWEGARERSFRLGDRLDTDALSSTYVNGVLTVAIPLRESEQPRRIEIGGATPAELVA
jgi:HSP20 family protein